jgi:hypothetical protein
LTTVFRDSVSVRALAAIQSSFENRPHSPRRPGCRRDVPACRGCTGRKRRAEPRRSERGFEHW